MAIPASTTVGVTAAQAAQQGKQWAELRTASHWLGWLEFDPVSARHVILLRALNRPDAEAVEITPTGYSVRGAVHEYGGGSWALFNDGLVFVNTSDQRLYWQSLDLSSPHHPPEFSPPKLLFSRVGCRYGDLTPAPESLSFSNHHHLGRSNHRHLVLVEEYQPASGQPQNRLVAISFSDQKGFKTERTLLAEGEDFYSSPAFSPDGQQLAWLSWNHPDQPWLSTTLSCASVSFSDSFSDSGKPKAALSIERITQSINAEAQDYSLYQPGFDASGQLLVMSDQPPVTSEGSAQVANSWWQLVSCDPESGLQSNLYSPKSGEELGIAQWQLGTRTWAVGNNTVLVSGLDRGNALLGWIDRSSRSGKLEPVRRIPDFEQSAARYHSVCWNALHDRFYVLMESVDQPCQLLEIDTGAEARACCSVMQSLQALPDDEASQITAQITAPVSVVIETPDLPLYGHYYPALNPHEDGLARPLIIQLHGGPTAYADSSLDLQKHYWTHQGFGLLMLNYRGSSGFGRQYRHALKENWGVSDVEDVLTACEYAVKQGWAEVGKLFVRGNSAGGYTVLQVLSDPRAAHAGIAGGASLYGISDLLLLNAQTHKFESRYLSWLIGDPETQAERFRQRSPIEKLDDFNLPVIFFQGDRDRVVPPPQTRRLYDALQATGVLSEYCLFEGEGHGFRKAEHRQQLLERELDFYLKVLATGCL